jgi:hypothetical protein
LALLPEIQLAVFIVSVSALRAGRCGVRAFEVLHAPHVATIAANCPAFRQWLLRVADGNLLDVELPALGVEDVSTRPRAQLQTTLPSSAVGPVLKNERIVFEDANVANTPAAQQVWQLGLWIPWLCELETDTCKNTTTRVQNMRTIAL